MRKGSGLAALMALMTLSAQTAQQATDRKDNVANYADYVKRPMMVQNRFGGFSNSSLKASIYRNQRQYRKRCRQNPWVYKSKKHRSKN